eukprot:1950335-Pyramimonas_sp.AAC.1
MGPKPPSMWARMVANLRTPKARAMRFSDFLDKPGRSKGSMSVTSFTAWTSVSWSPWSSASMSG